MRQDYIRDLHRRTVVVVVVVIDIQVRSIYRC